MKKFINIIACICIIITAAKAQNTQDDDVYYNPWKKQVVVYPTLNSKANSDEEVTKQNAVADGDYYDSNTSKKIAENNTTTVERPFNADDYYDYSYTARLRRFHNSIPTCGYYDPYYTNSYWYSGNPSNFGSSIYLGYSWGPQYNNYAYMPSNYWGMMNNNGWGNNGWGMNNGWNNGWGNNYYGNNGWGMNNGWCSNGWNNGWGNNYYGNGYGNNWYGNNYYSNPLDNNPNGRYYGPRGGSASGNGRGGKGTSGTNGAQQIVTETQNPIITSTPAIPNTTSYFSGTENYGVYKNNNGATNNFNNTGTTPTSIYSGNNNSNPVFNNQSPKNIDFNADPKSTKNAEYYETKPNTQIFNNNSNQQTPDKMEQAPKTKNSFWSNFGGGNSTENNSNNNNTGSWGGGSRNTSTGWGNGNGSTGGGSGGSRTSGGGSGGRR